MEALQKYAITLIYPDGVVEKIPITNLKWHIAYYRKHMENSPRFASLLRGINFPDDNMDEIKCRNKITGNLNNNGILIIENINIRDIVKNISFLNISRCSFLVYFPEFFCCKKQLEAYTSFVGDYSNKLLSFGRYNSRENHLDILDENEMVKFINSEKIKFDIDELKR